MITHIRTKGFKGLDIDEDIPDKVIYNGKNRSGKSTRSEAIAFAILGHVPFSLTGKLPSDILDSFGTDSISSAVTIKGVEFGRKIWRNDAGKVSTSLQIDKKRASADIFSMALGRVGAPKIVDVSQFMAQSDAKKVDTLFDLFPNPELSEIDQEISNAKEDVSRIEKQKDGAESTITRLTNSKNAIEKPAGTIAEIQASILEYDNKIAYVREQIKQDEIKEAERKAIIEGERQERERAEKEAADMRVIAETKINVIEESFLPDDEITLKTDEDWTRHNIDNMPDSPEMAKNDRIISGLEQQISKLDPPCIEFENFDQKKSDYAIVSDSILTIIEALTGAGCEACAALVVAKMELKKFKGIS